MQTAIAACGQRGAHGPEDRVAAGSPRVGFWLPESDFGVRAGGPGLPAAPRRAPGMRRGAAPVDADSGASESSARPSRAQRPQSKEEQP